MAKSQLEIVLTDDGGDGAAPPATPPSPSVDAVDAARVTGPGKNDVADTTMEEPTVADSGARSSESSPLDQPGRTAEPSEASAAAMRVGEFAAKQLGLGPLVDALRTWSEPLRDAANLLRQSAGERQADHQASAAISHLPETSNSGQQQSTSEGLPSPTDSLREKSADDTGEDRVAELMRFLRAAEELEKSLADTLETVRSWQPASARDQSAGPDMSAPTTTVVGPDSEEDSQQPIRVEVKTPRDTTPTLSTPAKGSAATKDQAGATSKTIETASQMAEPVARKLGLGPLTDAMASITKALQAAPGASTGGAARFASAAAPAASAASVVGAGTASQVAPAMAGAAASNATGAVTPAVVGAATGVGASGASGGVGAMAGAAFTNPITAVAVTLVAAFAAVAVGAKMLYGALSSSAEKLEAFSPDVAGARGMSQVRSDLAMYRRAERIGPDLAKFEQFKGRAEERLIDVGTTLLELGLRMWEKIEPAIDTAVDGISIGIEAASAIEAMLEKIAALMPGGETPEEAAKRLDPVIKKATDRIAKILSGEDDDLPLNDPFLDQFLAWGTPSAIGTPTASTPVRAARRGGP